MTLYTKHEDEENDGYATKPKLWRPISNVIGGFDLDPASGAENEQIADDIYTIEDNGLQQSWVGNVWLNPPFSKKLEFYRKAVNEYGRGNADMIVALSPSDTSTKWFQNWFSQANILCYLEGRDWYVQGGSPSFNTVVGVWGETTPELLRVLERKGTVTKTINTTEQLKL